MYIEFGRLPHSFHTAVEDFNRSALGDQISFTCAGWCGSCGPISGQIRVQRSTEFSKFMPLSYVWNSSTTKYKRNTYVCIFLILVSVADAQVVICHK